MHSLKGSFLIAGPGLTDSNFARTVVYMVEHNAEGAFGLVINRPDKLNLLELCQRIFDDPSGLKNEELLSSLPVFSGGPVQTSSVFFLHTQSDHGEQPVEPGVYLGNQADNLHAILADLTVDAAAQFRIFCGYAGWAPGQLENELKAGGWLVRPATVDEIFGPDSSLWSKLVQSFGGDLGILGLMPPEPGLN